MSRSNYSNLSQINYMINAGTASTAVLVTGFDFLVLSHLSLVQQKKGFQIVIALSFATFASRTTFLPACFYYDVKRSGPRSFYMYEAYWYLLLNNSFQAAMGYITLHLSIDRYLAVTRPVQYRIIAQKKFQIPIIAFSFFMGFMTGGVRWIRFQYLTKIGNDFDIIDDENVTGTQWHKGFVLSCNTLQYYIPSVLMVIIAVQTHRAFRAMERRDHELRRHGHVTQVFLTRLRVSLRVNIAFVVAYWVGNLPNGIADPMYTNRRMQEDSFAIFIMLADNMQTVGCMLTLMILTCFSSEYRATLTRIGRWLSCRETTREFFSSTTHSPGVCFRRSMRGAMRKRVRPSEQVFRIAILNERYLKHSNLFTDHSETHV